MSARVLIVQRRMTNYRVPLFIGMHRQLAAAGVRLQVVYGSATPAEELRDDAGFLPWGIRTRSTCFRLGSSYAVLQNIPMGLVGQQDLVVLPHENSLLFNYVLLMLRGVHRVRLAFWGHGANFQVLKRGLLRERFKAWISRQGHWWFAYTAVSAKRVAENGFPLERITCLNNSIHMQELSQWRDSILDSEIVELRLKLGLVGEKVGVFIGSLHRDKRIEFLLQSADLLRERIPEFELIVIGDGPLRSLLQRFAATRTWCKWVGAQHGREKVLYLAQGHVLLNPGMVGLGILDGFSMGLPLVTADCGIHSPEIAYLENEANGLMTADNVPAFVDGASSVLLNLDLRRQLVNGCVASSSRYSLEQMTSNFCEGILRALDAPLMSSVGETPSASKKSQEVEMSRSPIPEWRIAVIWQRFLPYHVARIRHLQARCAALGYCLTVIEAASQDSAYGFESIPMDEGFDHMCCFPGSSYHDHSATEIHAEVLSALSKAAPDVIFAPATPFPEGMAAVEYRRRTGCRTFMMDDAWEHTDIRGSIVTGIKRILHKNIDGVFIPAPSHFSYYRGLGFPAEKIIFGVDVVDNDFFSAGADQVRREGGSLRIGTVDVDRYFLFVGRFLRRKGLETLISAYRNYRVRAGAAAWDLVLVGGALDPDVLRGLGERIDGLHIAGPRFGSELCYFYGLASALIVPSESDPWGLVVNEGLASGLPVIVSMGCGAASTLVREGENGWRFPPGDVVALTELMLQMGAASPDALALMGRKSREIIARWSLDCFVDGVMQAMQLPRSMPAGFMSDMVSRLWKGRVSTN